MVELKNIYSRIFRLKPLSPTYLMWPREVATGGCHALLVVPGHVWDNFETQCPLLFNGNSHTALSKCPLVSGGADLCPGHGFFGAGLAPLFQPRSPCEGNKSWTSLSCKSQSRLDQCGTSCELTDGGIEAKERPQSWLFPHHPLPGPPFHLSSLAQGSPRPPGLHTSFIKEA